MNLHALSQQISRRFVTGLLYQRKETACGTGHCFLASQQLLEHFRRIGHAFTLFDYGQLGELAVSAGGRGRPRRECARQSGQVHSIAQCIGP